MIDYFVWACATVCDKMGCQRELGQAIMDEIYLNFMGLFCFNVLADDLN